MNKFVTLVFMFTFPAATIQAGEQLSQANSHPLDALQGAWWSNCGDPAAEFRIRGNEYSGDFAGIYKITLTGDVLVFNDGLIDGHSVNVTHKPLGFQVLKATETQLILRPLPDNPYVGDWHLESCNK